MLDEKAKQAFRAWGAIGGKARAKKYTKRQISLMARRSTKKRMNGKRRR